MAEVIDLAAERAKRDASTRRAELLALLAFGLFCWVVSKWGRE